MAKRLGLGTYRMVTGNDEHWQALTRALSRGSAFTVIDTSPNYGNGMAEQLVGKALKETNLCRGGELQDSVEIMTKFGYLQGSTLSQAKANGTWAEVAEYTKDCFHCIHPEFMRNQLTASLGHLGIERIDTYLVHNPEHALMEIVPPNTDKASESGKDLIKKGLDLLRGRLENTFGALEEEVDSGRISRYGVSCNSFALPDDHPHFIPFELILESAKSAARRHGKDKSSLAVFQMPGNLIEHTALLPQKFGGNGCAQFARKHGIETVVNRALTAFDSKGSWRLAEFPFPVDYQRKRDELLSQFRSALDIPTEGKTPEEVSVCEETAQAAQWLIQLIEDLNSQMTAFSSVMHYQDDLLRKIIPMINSKISGIDSETSDLIFSFFVEYEKAVRSVCGTQTRSHVAEQLNLMQTNILAQTGKSEAKVNNSDSECLPMPLVLDSDDKTLQQHSIGWLLNHPSVTTVLLGAIREKYVDEANELFGTV